MPSRRGSKRVQARRGRGAIRRFAARRPLARWAKPAETRGRESGRKRSAPTGAARGRAGELVAAGRDPARLLSGAVQEIGRTVVATSETLGRLELQAGRVVRGPLLGLVRATRATIRTAERVVTPRRAVAAVVLCAAVLLGVSQFVDYRGVGIGAPLYEGVEAVAAAPQTDREPAGSAHAYALLGVAILAIGALAFALRGRWRLGRAVSLLGAAGIAVSLLIDVPKGLDEGSDALAFEGAEAMLIEGFWVQLAASAVLLVTGVLLGRYVRAERQPAGRRARRAAAPKRRRRRRTARAAEVRA